MTGLGKYYLHVFRTLPLSELIPRIASRLAEPFIVLKLGLLGWKITDRALQAALVDNTIPLEKLTGQFLNPHLVRNHALSNHEIEAVLKDQFPDYCQTVVSQADTVCSKRYTLLGQVNIYLGDLDQWRIDPWTGYQWPQEYYKYVRRRRFTLPEGTELKFADNLTRFTHVQVLGEAYRITGDVKYALEFKTQVENWIEANPTGFGIGWYGSMSVAMRAINWLWAYTLCNDAGCFDAQWVVNLLKSLLAHGRYIYQNLETSGNHYVTNLVGLLYIGILVPELAEAKLWREFALAELERSLPDTILEDGVNDEGSVPYHRTVLEFLFCAALICQQNNVNVSETFRSRLKAMFRFTAACLKSNGYIPHFGDNGDDRLLGFVERPVLDHSYLPSLGALLFEDADFLRATGYFAPEALWFFGPEARERFAQLRGQPKGEPRSEVFERSGFAVLRRDQRYLFFRSGPLGQHETGGHDHNDQLSFELRVNDQDFVVDPGNYTYYHALPRMRNLFRSTAYHNTPVVDDTEQNGFINATGGFGLANNTKAKLTSWQLNLQPNEPLVVSGCHFGYTRLSNPVTICRSVELPDMSPTCVIHDTFEGSGSHQITWNFHLAPTIAAEIAENGVLLKGREITLRLTCSHEAVAGSAAIGDGFVSPSYRIKHEAKIVTFRYSGACPLQLSWIFDRVIG